MINFNWYKFSELSLEQLYTVLALRCEVFIMEQNCNFQDPDGKDLVALHLLGTEQNELVAYMRLFLPDDTQNYIVFGRVLTSKSARTKSYGKKLMQTLVDYCDSHFKGVQIKCSAQHYLQKFYEGFGFVAYGEIYDEDGIPHIAMKRDA